MRFPFSCLLLTFLMVCQMAWAQMSSSIDLSVATNFPPEKWLSDTLHDGVPVFHCSKERCGEEITVLVTQEIRTGESNVGGLNEFLQAGQFKIESIRRIDEEPVGTYAEGFENEDGEVTFFAAEERIKGNRIAVAVALASSLKAAQDSVKLVHLPALLK